MLVFVCAQMTRQLRRSIAKSDQSRKHSGGKAEAHSLGMQLISPLVSVLTSVLIIGVLHFDH